MPSAPPRATQLAILFADIAGSTQLYERLGDVAARGLVARCLGQLIEVAQRHGGTLVKTIGDEVMLTFATADATLLAAAEMQAAVSTTPMLEGRPLAVRIGLHFGPVLAEAEDVFGDAVNLAARMVNQAKAGQILTTGATVAAALPPWPNACRLVDVTTVRGKRHPVEVFEVIWQPDNSTTMRHQPRPAPTPQDAIRLLLTAGATRLTLSDEHPSLTIGRSEENDLVLPGSLVSRLHARLEYRRGRCILTDQSTNGTYLSEPGGPPRLLRHDSQVLAGEGMLSFGEAPAAGPAGPALVRYQALE